MCCRDRRSAGDLVRRAGNHWRGCRLPVGLTLSHALPFSGEDRGFPNGNPRFGCWIPGWRGCGCRPSGRRAAHRRNSSSYGTERCRPDAGQSGVGQGVTSPPHSGSHPVVHLPELTERQGQLGDCVRKTASRSCAIGRSRPRGSVRSCLGLNSDTPAPQSDTSIPQCRYPSKPRRPAMTSTPTTGLPPPDRGCGRCQRLRG
jgi:hypothetical protein